MVPRLIVDYPDDMTATNAIDFVRAVTKDGRISEAAGVPHFCWGTRFKGLCKNEDIMVATRRKKKGQTSDSFLVYREKKATTHG